MSFLLCSVRKRNFKVDINFTYNYFSVESGVPCANEELRQQLINKCEFLCPTDLVPYYDCPMQSQQFTCFCISNPKADCFQQCLDNNGKEDALQNATGTDAVLQTQLTQCRTQCQITGDDASSQPNKEGSDGVQIPVNPSSSAPGGSVLMPWAVMMPLMASLLYFV